MSERVYVVAEMSANHCGRLEVASETIRAAKDCGADAIKLQTYTADTMTLDCRSERFRISGSGQWDGRYLYDLYKEAAMPWEWQRELKAYADEIGIELFSSPFDSTAVDFLESIGVKRYKIASFEAVDIPLIRYAAKTGKPLIISTGVCTPEEIEEAVVAAKDAGCSDLTLLKCTSAYPAAPETMNLATIVDLVKRFGPQGVKVGLSDHTTSNETAVVAVALGATMVERHFILDSAQGGPDASFSATPDEFKAMVESIRLTEKLVGKVDYSVNPVVRNYMRSLYVCEDMKAGDVFTERNLRSIRPGGGVAPKFLPQLLGHRAARDLHMGTPLRMDAVRLRL